jgi:DNA modification methylase
MPTKDYFNKVVAIDALKGMQDLDTDSVDFIFSGIPYPDTLRAGGVEFDSYTDWLLPFAKEMYRVLKPSGSCVIIAHNQTKKIVDTWIYEVVLSLTKDVKFSLLQDFYWVKPNTPPSGMVSTYKRCRSIVEIIFWYGKDPDKTKVDTRKVLREYHNYVNVLGKIASHQKNIRETTIDKDSISPIAINKYDLRGDKPGSTPFNAIVGSPISHKDPIYDLMQSTGIDHPGRLPEFISEFFIKMLTEPGDIVLDPFVGSGATVTSAKKLGRKYVGFDIDKEYAKLSNMRLNMVTKPRNLEEWV